MAGIIHFQTFLIAGIVLNITPGNDTIFILSRSMSEGRKAGIISVLGIGTGCMVHTIFAAFGLSMIISRSLLAFNIVKFAGAAYVIFIGIQMLTATTAFINERVTSPGRINYLKIYRDGVLTNVLNPKVALFFIAFLPQFINPSFRHTVWPFLTLGATFVVTGTVWCLMLAIFAAYIFNRLHNNVAISSYIHKICGATLVGLGVKIALYERN